MAWDGVWHHKIDGVELNDQANGLICDVPEMGDLHEVEHIFVPIAGGYPVWHRMQPLSGRFTFQIHAIKDSDADWEAKMVVIKTVLTQDVPHVYTFQGRGMADEASVEVVFESLMVEDYKRGKMTALAVAPDPRPV